MAHPPGDGARPERTVDLASQFCERCGRDRDSFARGRDEFRECPACGAVACPDCWNLVDGACLKCAPFRLVDDPRHPRIVIASAAPAAAGADPYADLRGAAPAQAPGPPARATSRQRPKDQPAAGAGPADLPPDAWRFAAASSVAATDAPEPNGRPARHGPRRRAGRIGLAAMVAWAVVAALAVAAFGASPGRAPAGEVPLASQPGIVGPMVGSSSTPAADPTSSSAPIDAATEPPATPTVRADSVATQPFLPWGPPVATQRPILEPTPIVRTPAPVPSTAPGTIPGPTATPWSTPTPEPEPTPTPELTPTP